MDKLLDFGKGYRSYAAVAVLFVIGGLKAIGAIDEATAQTITTFAIGLGIFGLKRSN